MLSAGESERVVEGCLRTARMCCGMANVRLEGDMVSMALWVCGVETGRGSEERSLVMKSAVQDAVKDGMKDAELKLWKWFSKAWRERKCASAL